MFDSSLSYVLIASVGPVAATLAETPAFFEGTATSVMGAVGLAIWRGVNIATKSLEDSKKHREAEAEQWKAASEHRAAERIYWAS